MSWKNAASLILMTLKEKPYTSSFYNYQMLMLKRSDKSSFMPSGLVFPGGTVEEADSNSKWLAIFRKFSVPADPVVQLEKLPPIFQEGVQGFPRDLSLRITAIRETFEETGVLLCRNAPYAEQLWATVLPDDVSSWREKVQKDPNQFLNLCEAHHCFPDVHALKLWSNWLTPPDLKKRFDTVFFTACLPHQPASSADDTEIQQLQWFSPERLYRASQNNELWLPPPQFYELSRVMLFNMLEDLASFAAEREASGCYRFGAERLKTKQGLIFAGPGDDLHLIEDSGQFADLSFEELRNRSKKLHRLEIMQNGTVHIVVSGVKGTHGHILPLTTVKPKQCCKM